MKKIITIIALVITLIGVSRAVSFIMVNAPEKTETIATVVESYDNTIIVETPNGEVYSFYGDEPEENIIVITICNNEIVDAHSIPNYYTIGEVKDLAEEAGVYYIVKNANLDILNPDDYEDSTITDCGLIDDIDELGYCFFIQKQ